MAAALPKGVCMYDGYCTRKKPSHFTEFTHPSQYPNGYPLTAVAAPKKVPVAALPLATLVSDDDVPPHTPVNQTPSAQRKLSPPPTPHASRRHSTIMGVSSSDYIAAAASTTLSCARISITAAEASGAGITDYDKWRTPTLLLTTTNPFACFISSPTAVNKGHWEASTSVMTGAKKDPQWQHQQRADSFDSNATLLEDEEENTNANLSSSATAANSKRPRAPDVPTHTIVQPSVAQKEKGHFIDGTPRSANKVHVTELTSTSTCGNANGASLPSRAPIPLYTTARIGGVAEAGERTGVNVYSAVNSNSNVTMHVQKQPREPREDEKKRGFVDVASHSQPPASSANKKLPFLLQDVLDESPVLSDYLVSAPLLGPNDPIKTLADLYRLALPESEMRAILNLAIDGARPRIVGGAPTHSQKRLHDAILGAFPAVRLVGPFEHLLRIMLQEKAVANGSAQSNNLTRADFPSDVALWSDWRFRQDPLESITFLVPSALYDEHKLSTTAPLPNSSSVAADQQNTSTGQADICESTTIKAHEGNAIRLIRFGHRCSDGDSVEQLHLLPQPLQLDMTLPPVLSDSHSKSSVERLVSLSFYRDDWFEETIANNPSPPIQGSERDTKGGNGPSRQLTILRRTIVGPSSIGTLKKDTERNGNAAPTEAGQRLCSLSRLLSISSSSGGANGVIRPRFTPIATSVGRAVSHVIELLKEPLMKAIGGKEKTFVVDLKQLDIGQKLLTLYAPVTEKEVEKEKKRRDKQSFGTTFNQLRVCVPFVKYTEMGYRDPHLELAQLTSTIDKLTAFAAGGTYTHHPHLSHQSHSPATKCKGLSVKEREALDEELRCVDIGNDECDFGYGLEVGQNLLYAGCGGCLCKACIMEHLKEEEQEGGRGGRGGADNKHRHGVLERAIVGESLWHAVRVLDTAYGLLNRPFGRFALRCYVRLLVLGRGRFELAQAIPKN